MNITRGQKDEFRQLLPELVLLTARNIREYFHTKIQFSTPAQMGLRVFCAYCEKCRVNFS
jgi:hypothetical protein